MRNRHSHYDRQVQRAVWRISDEIRSLGSEQNLNTFLELWNSNGIDFSIDALRLFDERFLKGKYFISSQDVVSFLAKLVSNIEPKTVLDPVRLESCAKTLLGTPRSPKIKNVAIIHVNIFILNPSLISY